MRPFGVKGVFGADFRLTPKFSFLVDSMTGVPTKSGPVLGDHARELDRHRSEWLG